MRVRRKCESARKGNLEERRAGRMVIPCPFDATSVEMIEGDPLYTCPQHGSARHKRPLEEDEKWIEVEEPEPEPEAPYEKPPHFWWDRFGVYVIVADDNAFECEVAFNIFAATPAILHDPIPKPLYGRLCFVRRWGDGSLPVNPD